VPGDNGRPIRVYTVDDEPMIHSIWRRILPRDEFEVVSFPSAQAALEALRTDPAVDVMATDLSMPGTDGMELLRLVKSERPEVEVIMVTGYAELATAVTAVKAGAYHFIAKPFEGQAPELVVKQAAERKRLIVRTRELEHELREQEAAGATRGLVGASEPMQRLRKLIAAAAPASSGILILGESGTGKELVAHAIHRASPRSRRPFLAVNCSALAESLLESELFGHVRGAFTGAEVGKTGLFEAANGGTLMLDEIGEAPASVQAKLLRVLQEGEVKPVGSTKNVQVDVRVVAATNVDLEQAVRAGRFREDLYYRLNVLAIRVPALRERREDVAALAFHFLARIAAQLGREVRELSPDAQAALTAWHWPGNVRELENAIERAVILGRGHRIELADLPDAMVAAYHRAGALASASPPPGEIAPYAEAKARAILAFERRYVETLLGRAQGNISEAARLAGLDRSNFKRILRKTVKTG
jgi:two-component system, NtrC family, response regulator HydG